MFCPSHLMVSPSTTDSAAQTISAEIIPSCSYPSNQPCKIPGSRRHGEENPERHDRESQPIRHQALSPLHLQP